MRCATGVSAAGSASGEILNEEFEADYRRAFDALQTLLWPYSYSKQEIDTAESAHAKVRKGSGKLMIRDLKLNALEPGERAGIDRMTFDGEPSFP